MIFIVPHIYSKYPISYGPYNLSHMKPILTKYKGLVVHHSKTSKVMANICLTDCFIAIACLRLDRRSLKTKSVEQFGETWSCKLPTFPICLFCGAQYSWLTQALAPPSSEIKWKVSHFCITIFCYFVLLVWFIAENLFFFDEPNGTFEDFKV